MNKLEQKMIDELQLTIDGIKWDVEHGYDRFDSYYQADFRHIKTFIEAVTGKEVHVHEWKAELVESKGE